MSDRHIAGKCIGQQRMVFEDIECIAVILVDRECTMHSAAVHLVSSSNDARRFLTTMLECMKTIICDDRRFRMSKHTDYGTVGLRFINLFRGDTIWCEGCT